MKNLDYLNEYRYYYFGQYGDSYNGLFIIPTKKVKFQVIASNGMDWEHVSVTLKNRWGYQLHRCPTWEEMCFIKELFFEGNEVVMQLHPSEEEYVNNHPYCLHLWKPKSAVIPTPPSELVGIKTKKLK